MFGFSLTKLLVLVAIIAAVWYGFKLLSRSQVRRAVRARDAGRGHPHRLAFALTRVAAVAAVRLVRDRQGSGAER